MHFDNGFFISFHFMHAYMNRIYACYFFFFWFRWCGCGFLFLFFVCFCSFRCTAHTHTCGGQCATSFQHYIFGQWSLTFRIRNAIKNILLSARHESQAINNRHTVSFEEMCTTNHVTHTHTHTLIHSLTRTNVRDDKFKKPQICSVILLPYGGYKFQRFCWFGKITLAHTMHVNRRPFDK